MNLLLCYPQILIRMNKLCISRATPLSPVKPRKHEQRLLRNVGVHTIVLDLLQVPYDMKEDIRMNELMRLAHQFLQNFCLGNQQNQVLLHKHLDLFLNPGVNKSSLYFFLFSTYSAYYHCFNSTLNFLSHIIKHPCSSQVEWRNRLLIETALKSKILTSDWSSILTSYSNRQYLRLR